MPRESVEQKGRRYLAEGRLIVKRVGEGSIAALCRGGGSLYRLGFDGHEWHCDCPARTRCAHLTALMLVTVDHDDRWAA